MSLPEADAARHRSVNGAGLEPRVGPGKGRDLGARRRQKESVADRFLDDGHELDAKRRVGMVFDEREVVQRRRSISVPSTV